MRSAKAANLLARRLAHLPGLRRNAGWAGGSKLAMSSGIRIGAFDMTQTGFSLMGAALGAVVFISAGREPLRRLIESLKNR